MTTPGVDALAAAIEANDTAAVTRALEEHPGLEAHIDESARVASQRALSAIMRMLAGRTKSTLDEEQSRLFMHFVVSEAGTSEIDKAGRILIPGKLRKLVPLDEDQEIILVGLYHRMEIWNPSEWRRYIARSEDRYEQNMAKILNLL